MKAYLTNFERSFKHGHLYKKMIKGSAKPKAIQFEYKKPSKTKNKNLLRAVKKQQRQKLKKIAND